MPYPYPVWKLFRGDVPSRRPLRSGSYCGAVLHRRYLMVLASAQLGARPNGKTGATPPCVTPRHRSYPETPKSPMSPKSPKYCIPGCWKNSDPEHERAGAEAERIHWVPRRTPETYLTPPSSPYSCCGECKVSGRLVTCTCSQMCILCVCAEHSGADVVFGVCFRTFRVRTPKFDRVCRRY